MRGSRLKHGLLGTLTLAIAANSACAAVTIWSQNFDLIGTGAAYADSTVLSSAVGTTDDVGLRTGGATSNFQVVDQSGNHALRFIDNNATQNTFPKANSAFFNGVISTGATGNNYFTGSFTYTRLLTNTAVSTSPVFVFTASSPSSGNELYLSVEADGKLKYQSGGSMVDSGYTLVTGTEYVFKIAADLSSTTQDKWSLNVATLAAPQTPVMSASNLNTIVANTTINLMSFWGGLNTTGVNSAAFGQVDNLSFTAQLVPEPASAGLLLLAGAGLLRRRR